MATIEPTDPWRPSISASRSPAVPVAVRDVWAGKRAVMGSIPIPPLGICQALHVSPLSGERPCSPPLRRRCNPDQLGVFRAANVPAPALPPADGCALGCRADAQPSGTNPHPLPISNLHRWPARAPARRRVGRDRRIPNRRRRPSRIRAVRGRVDVVDPVIFGAGDLPRRGSTPGREGARSEMAIGHSRSIRSLRRWWRSGPAA